jgi:transposase-like protein
MRKNQKYTKEQMYQAIEGCKQEGLSHMQYCKRTGINYQTFKFWVRKYNREKSTERSMAPTFMPVQVVQPVQFDQNSAEPGYITITYPNGIQVSCPVNVPPVFLKSLLKP